MGFTCGIVGLPNVGKSTIFNALTSAKAASENFPFCTIEPNTGTVPLPDPRLHKLAEMASSAKLIPTQMTFVDIAGLIKGASQGEGLGNQFLGHIRSVDAIAHVVRCFDDENIIHVEGTVDPIRDVETIDTELILSDLDAVQKQALKYQKLSKAGDKEPKAIYETLQALESNLGQGKPARSIAVDKEHPAYPVYKQLLTSKPVLFVANVHEDDAATQPDPTGSRPLDKLAHYAANQNCEVVVISGKVESELAELEHDDRLEYLQELGLESSGLDRLTLAGYRLLNLLTFFTIGPKEAHAWTAINGMTAPQCAGKIHTDFERGFIRAEVFSYEDYVAHGGEVKAKEAGKMRVEGKDYIFQDGDIVHFRFNV
ncbi:MAG: redox-regulated ATPase YchF [Bdellovibrionales bacterium]|nr:redox-regulated ATPase YchF [Bdellovibrionales bacterium]